MLIHADAKQMPLRDGCVQCIVTSPPYWRLRDYGIANQIGMEPTPSAYVNSLVTVFRELWRILKPDGVCWLNLGDSYFGDSPARTSSAGAFSESWDPADSAGNGGLRRSAASVEGLRPKNLIGIPWRVAFALQDEGWYLRSDVIWNKPNPMPEAVTDRPTRAHEYVFLLTKSARYFYDESAIREASVKTGTVGHRRAGRGARAGTRTGLKGEAHDCDAGRNRRSVWTIPVMPYEGAHFATMPEGIVTPCILAGSRPGDLVLDPFIGSGTVGAVAERLDRRWVGTDLNPTYHPLAKKRTAQRAFRFEAPPAPRAARLQLDE